MDMVREKPAQARLRPVSVPSLAACRGSGVVTCSAVVVWLFSSVNGFVWSDGGLLTGLADLRRV